MALARVRALLSHDRAIAAAFLFALLLVFVSVAIGGASQANALCQMTVELASLPLFFAGLYLCITRGVPKGSAFALVIMACVLALPLIQLVPLPFEFWTRLPGRAIEMEILKTAHLGRQALPLSLTPDATWRAFLALIPPASMFLGALHLSDEQRRAMAGCWLVLAFASLVLGGLQMMGGEDSPLYLYSITNAGSPVGFFSNRNHEAAFLNCMIPVAVLFASKLKNGWRDPAVLGGVLALAYLPLAMVGIATTLSRAGVFLLGAALLSGVAVAMRGGLRGKGTAIASGAGLLLSHGHLPEPDAAARALWRARRSAPRRMADRDPSRRKLFSRGIRPRLVRPGLQKPRAAGSGGARLFQSRA